VGWCIMMQKPLLSAPLAQSLLIGILPETPTSQCRTVDSQFDLEQVVNDSGLTHCTKQT